MRRDKLDGSFIKNMRRRNKRDFIINLKNGEQLLLKAEPTDFGEDAEIKIFKMKDGNINEG